MAAWTRTAAFGLAFAVMLPLPAAAAELVWEHPDGSPAVRIVVEDLPVIEDEAPGPIAAPPQLAVPGQEVIPPPKPEIAPRPAPAVVVRTAPAIDPPLPPATAQPDGGKKRRHQAKIPPGHLPPPGYCRIWHPDRPPGHQPPPGPCEVLERQVPPGAIIVRG
jgi:hypothetical protein